MEGGSFQNQQYQPQFNSYQQPNQLQQPPLPQQTPKNQNIQKAPEEFRDSLYPARELLKAERDAERQKKWEEEQAQYEKLKSLRESFHSSGSLPLPKPGENSNNSHGSIIYDSNGSFSSFQRPSGELPKPSQQNEFQRPSAPIPRPSDMNSFNSNAQNFPNYDNNPNSSNPNLGNLPNEFSNSFSSLLQPTTYDQQGNQINPNGQQNGNAMNSNNQYPGSDFNGQNYDSSVPLAYRNANQNMNSSVNSNSVSNEYHNSQYHNSTYNESQFHNNSQYNNNNLYQNSNQQFDNNQGNQFGHGNPNSNDSVDDLTERIKRLSSVPDFNSYHQSLQGYDSGNDSDSNRSSLPPTYSAAQLDDSYSPGGGAYSQPNLSSSQRDSNSFGQPFGQNGSDSSFDPNGLYQDIDLDKNDDILTPEEWQLAVEQNNRNSRDFPNRDAAMYYGEVCNSLTVT